MRKMLKRMVALSMVLSVVISNFTFVHAATRGTILNNGLNGIYVDINAKPYISTEDMMTTLRRACTWYVGARVTELTGKNPGIWTGKVWYNNGKGNFGYTAGNAAPTGKAVACYTNHVSVVEAFDGKTYTISEGGTGSGVEHKCCQITTRTLSQIKNLNGSSGTFLGFVYLGVPFPQSDTEKPVIKNALVSNITSTGFDVSCIATDNVDVERVSFPTWTKYNGQDDLVWHEATYTGGRWKCHISISQHKGEVGTYITHVYAYDKAGNSSMQGIGEYTVGAYANDIKLDRSNLELKVGEEAYLKATVYPSNAVDKTVKWTSSNSGIVTIEDGKIIAKGVGAVTIKASLANMPMNGNRYAYCTVNVKDNPLVLSEDTSMDNISMESEQERQGRIGEDNSTTDANQYEINHMSSEDTINDKENTITVNMEMNRSSVLMGVGTRASLFARNNDEIVDNSLIEWTSSNQSVATVDNKGLVTGISGGRATIAAKLKDSSTKGNTSAICEVEIHANTATRVDVTMDRHELQMEVGETTLLNAEISSSEPISASIRWISSNPSVAIVDNGQVKAVGTGTAIIKANIGYAPPEGRWQDACTVTVTEDNKEIPVTGVKLANCPSSLRVGDMKCLYNEITPSNATNKNSKFTSSNPDVALIVDGRWLIAMGEGETTISAITQDGGYTDSKTLTVRAE